LKCAAATPRVDRDDLEAEIESRGTRGCNHRRHDDILMRRDLSVSLTRNRAAR
jgi:hypothetical protein